MLKITNIYDNFEADEKFKSDWGLALLIQYKDKTIIFDTGAQPEILKNNLEVAEVKPESIDIMIVSHKHWDHIGGAEWLAEQNPNIKIYLPKTWRNKVENKLYKKAKNIESISKYTAIDDNLRIIVSKNLFVTELALIIHTSKGIIAITGCSHTGIDKILKETIAISNEKIYCIIGGFHLFRSSKKKISRIVNYLKALDIELLAPCHCTGDRAEKIISQSFPIAKNGVGAQYIMNLDNHE